MSKEQAGPLAERDDHSRRPRFEEAERASSAGTKVELSKLTSLPDARISAAISRALSTVAASCSGLEPTG